MSLFEKKTDTEKELENFQKQPDNDYDKKYKSNQTTQKQFNNNPNQVTGAFRVVAPVWVTILFIFVSIIATAIYAGVSGNPGFLICIFGFLFFLGGLALLISEKFNLKKIGIFFIFPIFGLGLFFIGLSEILKNMKYTINYDKVVPVFIFGFLLLIGLSVLIFPIIQKIQIKNSCTVEVDAVVVDITSTYDVDSGTRYVELYQYDYKGKSYYQKLRTSIKYDPERLGAHRLIHINPNDPNEVYVKNIVLDIFLFIFGLAFTVPSLVALINHIRSW